MTPATPRRLSVSDKVLYGDRMLAALRALVEALEPGTDPIVLGEAKRQARALLREVSPEEEGQ